MPFPELQNSCGHVEKDGLSTRKAKNAVNLIFNSQLDIYSDFVIGLLVSE